MKRDHASTFTMNITGRKPDVIIVRYTGVTNWRRDMLPAIKMIAEDVADGPVPWKHINVFEGLDCEDELAKFDEWVERGLFCLYRIDAPCSFTRV